MSVAGSNPFVRVHINAPQRYEAVSWRFSVPNIEIKRMPSEEVTVNQTPPKKTPSSLLKLYPWMTRKESPPKRETRIRCPYPTNNCTEALPKNMAVWRKHLVDKHGLAKDTILQTCQFPGCERTMGGRSLNRHVLFTHMDFKVHCPYCRKQRRLDHLEKHIKNCPENPARQG